MNHTLFALLNATKAGPGAVASLEALAVVPVFLLPVLVVGAWLLGGRQGREAAVMAAVSGCLAMMAAHLASVLVVHPRPFMEGWAPNILDHVADSSFPSDHATLFFAIAVMFVRRPLPSLPGLGFLLSGLGLAVGLARVALGVHFPLDVLGAIAIGAGAALVTELAFRGPGRALFRLGERVRSLIAPLAKRDCRDLTGHAHPHP